VLPGYSDQIDKWSLSLIIRLPLGDLLARTSPHLPARFKAVRLSSLEILALRHQIGVLQRSVKRPKLKLADRLLWAWLCTVWRDWKSGVSSCKPPPLSAGTAGLAPFLELEDSTWETLSHAKSLRLLLSKSCRTHLWLQKDTPEPRVQSLEAGGSSPSWSLTACITSTSAERPEQSIGLRVHRAIRSIHS
jgi:hypothetical protein